VRRNSRAIPSGLFARRYAHIGAMRSVSANSPTSAIPQFHRVRPQQRISIRGPHSAQPFKRITRTNSAALFGGNIEKKHFFILSSADLTDAVTQWRSSERPYISVAAFNSTPLARLRAIAMAGGTALLDRSRQLQLAPSSFCHLGITDNLGQVE